MINNDLKISFLNNYLQIKNINPFNSQIKLLHHAKRVGQYLEGDCYPIFMEILLTNKCNLNCKWCICGNNKDSKTLKTNTLLTFLEDAYNNGLKAVTWSGGGEPTIHPDFIKISNATKEIGLKQGLMTNGIFPNESIELCNTIVNNIQWVRISVDTLNNENYKNNKGIDKVDFLKTNIKTLYRQKKKLKIGLNCNVSEDLSNFEIDELIQFAEKYADYIQFRPILPRKYANEKVELKNAEAWKYILNKKNDIINCSLDKLQDMIDPKQKFEKCHGHYFEPILDASGEFKVCSYHYKDNRFSFGNIYKNDFKTIWNSKKRKEVINFVDNLCYEKHCQYCCKLCEISKVLDWLRSTPEDVDFL